MISNIIKPISVIRLILVRSASSRAASKPRDQYDDFGHLSRSGSKNLDILAAQDRIKDDADGYDKQEFEIKPRKNEFYYKYEITNQARKCRNGLKRALELFREMKQEAKLTPDYGHFCALIYGCAKAGQTKKAFELYEEGLKYFKKPSGAMANSLIDACSESPFPEYGLKRLDWLRTHLRAYFNFEMRDIHYRCMIKAYGKLGRIDLAAKIFKEMVEAGIQPTTDTFNMLMIGCASQKESGTLLALRLYKRMRMYGIKPNTITYSNFLRCIHYCGMGSPELLKQTFEELPAMTTFEQRLAYKAFKKRRPVVEAAEEFEWLPSTLDLTSSVMTATSTEPIVKSAESDVKHIEAGPVQSKEICDYGNPNELTVAPAFLNCDSLPNLLSDDHLTLMQRIKDIQFDKLKSGPSRFQLFGGPEGFLDMMKRDGAEPDMKMFSRLVSLVKPNRSELLPVFHLVKEYPITRTEQFYNNLIRVACSDFVNPSRMNLALTFLEEMHRDKLIPTVETFECLAPACNTWAKALTLIDDIERCGYVVSDKLIERLFDSASRAKNFGYLIEMVEICRTKFNNFLPTRELLEMLEATIVAVNRTLVQYEKGRIGPRANPWLEENNIAKFDSYKQMLGEWLKTIEVQDEEHPWAQFDVKMESKRQGFVDYVKEFRALERAKQEALERGESFGNLYARIKTAEGRSPSNQVNSNQGQAA